MQIKDNVYSVGVLNPSLRVFDIIMRTEYGTSYNAYLIKGEKNVLIETVHEDFFDEYRENVEKYIDIKDIDCLIMNHTEPDHSGSIKKLLQINPDIRIYATNAALKNIRNIVHMDFESVVVKPGDMLCLGDKTIEFIVAPNLHWPDSMFSYLKEEKILFSCDFLGSHYCVPRVLSNKMRDADAYEDAFLLYYQAIFGPFKPFVLQGLDKIKDKELDMVCPSHGPILVEDDIDYAVEKYREWSTPGETVQNVAIFYVSAYGYTKEMAECIKDEIQKEGVKVNMYNIIEHDMAFLSQKMHEATALVFGSPTINRDAVKPVWDLIATMDAINIKGKKYLTIGSYGWSGEAVKNLENRLDSLKLKKVADGIRAVFRMDDKVQDTLKDAAHLLIAE